MRKVLQTSKWRILWIFQSIQDSCNWNVRTKLCKLKALWPWWRQRWHHIEALKIALYVQDYEFYTYISSRRISVINVSITISFIRRNDIVIVIEFLFDNKDHGTRSQDGKVWQILKSLSHRQSGSYIRETTIDRINKVLPKFPCCVDALLQIAFSFPM